MKSDLCSSTKQGLLCCFVAGFAGQMYLKEGVKGFVASPSSAARKLLQRYLKLRWEAILQNFQMTNNTSAERDCSVLVLVHVLAITMLLGQITLSFRCQLIWPHKCSRTEEKASWVLCPSLHPVPCMTFWKSFLYILMLNLVDEELWKSNDTNWHCSANLLLREQWQNLSDNESSKGW